ncbi:hypothetical protein PG985_008079 [Apiospora marii]|uniref:uncharacterized protein n=1 Tax=Apiospora marii TaxID=335849 RepID=UPI00313039EA
METLRQTLPNVVMDEDGDLLIKIIGPTASDEKREFLVDTHDVARSSEKFRELVMTGEAGSGVSMPACMVLEGDAESYGVLFSIMHCKFADVPLRLSKGQLFALLTITEDYQATHLLKPWTATWLAPHQDLPRTLFAVTNQTVGELHKRLWIAWVLGEKGLFRKSVKRIIEKINIDGDSNIFIEKIPFSQKPEIPGLSDYLKREYHNRTQELYRVFESLIERHMNSQNFDSHDASEESDCNDCECSRDDCQRNGEFCRLCVLLGVEEVEMCNSIVIGSMTRGFHRKKSYLASCDPSGRSVKIIYEQLREIKIYCFATLIDYNVSTTEHCFCNPSKRIHANLDGIMNNIANVLDPTMETHLEHRAKLTGLDEQSMKAREIAPKKNRKKRRESYPIFSDTD